MSQEAVIDPPLIARHLVRLLGGDSPPLLLKQVIEELLIQLESGHPCLPVDRLGLDGDLLAELQQLDCVGDGRGATPLILENG